MAQYNRNRAKKQEQRRGAPAWMVTYGDLMSLLLTFFVLLLSFSSITEEKFEEALISVRDALGLMPQNLSIVSIEQESQIPPRPSRSIERVAREMQRRLQVLGREQDVDLEYDEGGIKVNLPSEILFESARAEVRSEAYDVLDTLAEVLGDLPDASFEVRGHTDSRPLRSSVVFEDNYDLSYGRAKSVTTYLTEMGEAPLEQFEIVALGPAQPVASNETDEGRLRNRRVELQIRGQFEEAELEELHERFDEQEGLNESSAEEEAGIP